ncbi:MAG: hypothetical protein ACXWUG_31685 [Polyangiales bacterium]
MIRRSAPLVHPAAGMIPDRAVTIAVVLLAVVCAIELVHVIGVPGQTFQQSLALAGLLPALFVLASELRDWYRARRS